MNSTYKQIKQEWDEKQHPAIRRLAAQQIGNQ